MAAAGTEPTEAEASHSGGRDGRCTRHHLQRHERASQTCKQHSLGEIQSSLWTVGGLEPLFLRARGRWTQVRARRSLEGVVTKHLWLLPAAVPARTSWRGWRKRLQEQKCPARPRTRLTRQARRGQPGDESRTACCRPDPSPSPAISQGHPHRYLPRAVSGVLKVALVLFPPVGAGCSGP